MSLAASLARDARVVSDLLERLARNYGNPFDAVPNFPIVTPAPFSWPELDVEGRRLQVRALKEYRRFETLLLAVLPQAPSDIRAKFHQAQTVVRNILERRAEASNDRNKLADDGLRAIKQQVTLIDWLDGDHDDLILVPDTNAFYWNPALEHWRVPSGARFLIALTPTVIDEIDRHKNGSGRDSRREKAGRLIRQIGQYRERGHLLDGVTLVRDTSKVFAVASDSHPDQSLRWLFGSTMDDYYLASVLDVMRLNPRAPVVAITRDENLRSKIEFAGLMSWLPSKVVNEERKERKSDGGADRDGEDRRSI